MLMFVYEWTVVNVVLGCVSMGRCECLMAAVHGGHEMMPIRDWAVVNAMLGPSPIGQ